MHKEQLMELHQFFVHVYRELVPKDNDCEFMELYKKLDVKPHHIHKLKSEQCAAIFLLSACIADYMYDDDMISGTLSLKLLGNAFKHMGPKSKKLDNIDKYLELLREKYSWGNKR